MWCDYLKGRTTNYFVLEDNDNTPLWSSKQLELWFDEVHPYIEYLKDEPSFSDIEDNKLVSLDELLLGPTKILIPYEYWELLPM